MDSRNTLRSDEDFLRVLESFAVSKTKVAMLLYNNGMIRSEGIVDEIVIENQHPFLLMTDGNKIAVEKVVAVNGIFSPEYSEC